MSLRSAREILTRLELLPDFLFGVATAAYQVEGGLNGPGEPCNNWMEWERSRRVEPVGTANGFWRSPEALLDRAAALGLNGFRLGLEWARLEPRAGERDAAALGRYVEILLGCRQRGLEPAVTLHHFTHPAWLGDSPWTTDCDAVLARFVDHVRWTVAGIGDGLAAAGSPPIRLFVTLNEINVLPITTFVLGIFPPGHPLELGRALRMLDRLAQAHVLAYDAIHDLYEQRGWDAPLVTTNNFCFGLYEIDRLLCDVFTARERGVSEGDLGLDLDARRRRWNERIAQAPTAPGSVRWMSRLMQPLLGAARGRWLRGCREAVYRSPRARKLDVVAVDYYDPFFERSLRWPGRRAGLGRTWRPLAELCETPVNPDGLRWFIARAAEYGLPVIVLENGLCNERRGARRAARGDGWSRSRYLRANLLAVAEAVADGLPLLGYFHWTLADNYEWGSYALRFGLHGRDGGGVLEELDSMSEPSASVYAELVAALRSGRVEERVRVFLDES